MKTMHDRQDISTKKIVSTEAPHTDAGRTPKAAMAGGARFVVYILMFLASLAYAALGGRFAETAALEPEIVIAAPAAKPADVRTLAYVKTIPGSSSGPDGYFPAAYPNRGRAGDGNVVTYKHD